jgi:hypothetical protein
MHPPEFHYVNPCDRPASLFTHDLLAEGMSGEGCWIEDVAGVVERARKQGLRGITLRVDFEDPDRDRISIKILST